MIPFIKKNLAPNRLAVYFTAALALATAVYAVVDKLDFSSAAGAVGSLVVLGGVVIKWLDGWQQYESALYQRDLIAFQLDAQADATERKVQAAKAVSAPGSKTGGISLPR